MKTIVLSVCLMSCFFSQVNHCRGDEKTTFVSEKNNPPKALKSFWDGIESSWITNSEDEYWSENQRARVRDYCKQYAQKNDPNTIIPELVKDLKVRQSEVRIVIYTWIVINWKPEKTKALLEPYYLGKDPVEKQVAADLLAEVEQLASGK